MKRFGMMALAVLVSGCATMWPFRPDATAELKNARGEVVGMATLREDDGGIRISTDVRGLPPGPHGFHLHAVGKCDAPGFTTAGGHFNPTGKVHGMLSPQGPHAGDLPNIDVAADGTGRVTYFARGVTLGAGPGSLFDGDGAAVVVHAGPDDYKTDPAGNSGARIACGVVKRPS